MILDMMSDLLPLVLWWGKDHFGSCFAKQLGRSLIEKKR